MLKKFILPKGTIVKIYTVPLKLLDDIEVETHEENYILLVRRERISVESPCASQDPASLVTNTLESLPI